MRASRANATVARVCASIYLGCSVVSQVEIVKLPAHRAGLAGHLPVIKTVSSNY